MKKRLQSLSWMVVLLAVVLAAYFLRGFIREAVVEPLFFLYWVMQILYASLPQALLWGALILIGLYIGVSTLLRPGFFKAPNESLRAVYRGRVETWSRWIALAREGNYYRDRLANELTGLAAETISFHEQSDPQRIRKRIRSGDIDLPAHLSGFFKSGLTPLEKKRFSSLDGWFSEPSDGSQLDVELDQILEYLETELRMDHDEHRN